MTRLLHVAILVPLVVLLAGCSAETVPSTTSTAQPTSTASTPTPTPTPVPTKPAVSDLVATPEGIGPLVIGGAPPSADPELDILVVVPDGCEWAVAEGYTGDPGIWVANYDVDPRENALGPFGVRVANGILEQIGIYSEEITTEAGARLGNTRDELLAMYPTELEYTAGEGVDVYRLPGTAGDLLFSLWEGETGIVTVGQINISTPGFEVPLGGSDYGVFGVCLGP